MCVYLRFVIFTNLIRSLERSLGVVLALSAHCAVYWYVRAYARVLSLESGLSQYHQHTKTPVFRHAHAPSRPHAMSVCVCVCHFVSVYTYRHVCPYENTNTHLFLFGSLLLRALTLSFRFSLFIQQCEDTMLMRMLVRQLSAHVATNTGPLLLLEPSRSFGFSLATKSSA